MKCLDTVIHTYEVVYIRAHWFPNALVFSSRLPDCSPYERLPTSPTTHSQCSFYGLVFIAYFACFFSAATVPFFAVQLFECGECGVKFSRKNSLHQHENIHLEKYRCQTCGKSFGRPKYLLHHRPVCQKALGIAYIGHV
jgi:hypothetical protein